MTSIEHPHDGRITQLRLRGARPKEIAAELGVTAQVVYGALRRLGMQMRGPHAARSQKVGPIGRQSRRGAEIQELAAAIDRHYMIALAGSVTLCEASDEWPRIERLEAIIEDHARRAGG